MRYHGYFEHERVKLRKMSWVSSIQSFIDKKISLDPISLSKKSIYVTYGWGGS